MLERDSQDSNYNSKLRSFKMNSTILDDELCKIFKIWLNEILEYLKAIKLIFETSANNLS